MIKGDICFANTSYYPIQKRWRRLKPLFKSDQAKNLWLPNLLDFQLQKCHDNGFPFRERAWRTPSDFDSCDWRCERRGRSPEYWDFACHAACHFVVDMCLYVAQLSEPNYAWRVLTHRDHSTTWNGDRRNPVLFDINFLALKVEPSEALRLAAQGRELKPGKFLRGYKP